MIDLERLWDDYVAASRRAQQTQDIDDGIAAGRAWAAWLAAFAADRRPPPRPSGEQGNVITLRRRP